jgi:lipid A 3-O-deacylase
MIRSKVKRQIIPRAILIFLLGGLLYAEASQAEDAEKDSINDRYSLGIVLGNTYDPKSNIDFYMLSGSVLYDYEKIWHHKAPEPLRFKVEYNIGTARDDNAGFMTSLNIFALYYLNLFKDSDISPYVEGGVGIIYTDFQVEGQGLKINFNPQMGIGAEFKTESIGTYFLCFRLHHISNGGLYSENRGVNSVVFMLGRFF